MADYRKLPVKKRSVHGLGMLYLTADHLLSLESSIYTENYYRFHFTDIEAIVTRRTDRGGIGSLLLGFLAVLMTTCTIAAATPPANGIMYFWGVLAAVFVLVAGYNLYLGPTCVTHIHTAAGAHEVPALSRIRSTERILRQIRPFIDQAQGGVLSREAIRQGTVIPPELLEAPPPDAGARQAPAAEGATGPAAPAYGRTGVSGAPVKAYLFLYLSMLAFAATGLLWIYYPGPLKTVLNMLVTLVMLGLLVTSMVLGSEGSRGRLRKISWAGIVGLIAIFAAGYAATMYYSISYVASGDNPYRIYTDLATYGPGDMPVMAAVESVAALYFAGLGLWGLVSLVTTRAGSPAGR